MVCGPKTSLYHGLYTGKDVGDPAMWELYTKNLWIEGATELTI